MGEFYDIKYTSIQLSKRGVGDGKKKMGVVVPRICIQLPEAWENFRKLSGCPWKLWGSPILTGRRTQ